MRYKHHKYTWTNPYESVRHQWEFAGARGGIHFHVTLFKGSSPTGGLEYHYRTPPSHMVDEVPHNCWLIHGACWHEGTSLYATDTLWPMFEPMLKRGEHEKIFKILEEHADKMFY